MAKISKEEYKFLKSLDEKWKWIARDESGELYIHEEKPKKFTVEWVSGRDFYLYLGNETFQFIQWEDEEPYSISELIEEYEKEREETEVKKDIEWLKEEIRRRDKGYIYKDDLMDIINKVDEPEVLSQEWIDNHSKAVAYDGMPDQTEVVYVDDLQNLLAPKQELPVIPRFVADYLDFAKSEVPLMRVMELANTRDEWPKWNEKEYDWISANDETFARAWLDGFTVEEEPKYYALIKGHEKIGSDDKYWNYCIADEGLDIGDNKVHADVLAEYVLSATKDEWENLGINDDNADFVKVEELEEND